MLEHGLAAGWPGHRSEFPVRFLKFIWLAISSARGPNPSDRERLVANSVGNAPDHTDRGIDVSGKGLLAFSMTTGMSRREPAGDPRNIQLATSQPPGPVSSCTSRAIRVRSSSRTVLQIKPTGRASRSCDSLRLGFSPGRPMGSFLAFPQGTVHSGSEAGQPGLQDIVGGAASLRFQFATSSPIVPVTED